MKNIYFDEFSRLKAESGHITGQFIGSMGMKKGSTPPEKEFGGA